MRLIVSPGLPTWPRLMLDQNRLRAKVTARFPTWRGREKAGWVTEMLVYVERFVCVLITLRLVPPYEDLILRVVIGTIVWGVMVGILDKLVRLSMPGFLTRTVFASRVTIWFSPEAIGFKSRWFRKGILIWRQWNRLRVPVQFSVTEDDDAMIYDGNLPHTRQDSKYHLLDSKILCVYLRTPNDLRMTGLVTDGVFRSIPITEMGKKTIANFVVVCNAALTLTDSASGLSKPLTKTGIDIDNQ